MGRLKSTEGSADSAAAGSLLANSKAVVVLGLGTLELDILRNHLVRHLAAAAHEVATCPQVPTPILRPQPSVIGQEVMGGLALYRLHDTTRREVRRDTQQQVDVIRPNVPLQNLYVMRSTDLPDQIPHLRANFTAEHRLAILRDEYEVVVQRIDRMGRSTILLHGRPSYRKPPEGFA